MIESYRYVNFGSIDMQNVVKEPQVESNYFDTQLWHSKDNLKLPFPYNRWYYKVDDVTKKRLFYCNLCDIWRIIGMCNASVHLFCDIVVSLKITCSTRFLTIFSEHLISLTGYLTALSSLMVNKFQLITPKWICGR